MSDIKFSYNKSYKVGVIEGEYELVKQIRTYFSVENTAKRFADPLKRRHIPERTYVITPTGRFQIGLYYEIRKYLRELQFVGEISHTKEFLEQLKPAIDSSVVDELALDLRYYQHDMIERCLKFGRGVGLLGTGGGKTLITAALIDAVWKKSFSKNNFRCLVIVPDLGLVRQTHEEFKEFQCKFSHSMWTGSGDELNRDSNVVICNAGILTSRYKENDWINDVDFLIVDEAHKIKKGNELTKIVSKIKTPNRFGLTGTLPDKKEDKWNVIGTFGPVIYEKTSSELRNEGFLTQCKCKLMKLFYTGTPSKPTKEERTTKSGKEKKNARYLKEMEFIMDHDYRNKVITTIVKNFDNNALILVNRIEHGEILEKVISEALPGKKVHFVQGKVDSETREEVKKIMETYDDVVCIAMSQIFSTGINIKNIHMILLAAGGKSAVRLIQSIGRGLRLNDNKDELLIVDIVDMLEYGIKHLPNRLKVYDKEKVAYSSKSLIQRP